MNGSLAVYLHDHLAGANFAVELLENLKQRHSDHETSAFASAVLAEVREDRRVLESIIERVGKAHFDGKDAMAWIAEKASRVKLSHDQPDGLSTFEALEMLDLGVMGKVSLWRVLTLVANFDSRLTGFDFQTLTVRAQEQFDTIEKYKLSLAKVTFEKI